MSTLLQALSPWEFSPTLVLLTGLVACLYVRAEFKFGIKTKPKILYFTQLLGLALGLSARRLAIHENVSDSIDLLEEKGIL